MPDLDRGFYDRAADVLGTQRDAYKLYMQILDAQRAAMGSNNIRLVTALAQRLQVILGEIQTASRLLAPTYHRIQQGRVDGPRTQSLKDLMTAVAAEAALAQASVRALTSQVAGVQAEIARELDLDPTTNPTPTAGRPRGGPQPALIDTIG